MLSAQILAVMLALAPAGRSPYSVVVVPECGTDRASPTCELKPVCEEVYTLACAAPHWSSAHGAFVRQENAEEARARYEVIANAIAHVAVRAAKPVLGPDGVEKAPLWPWGSNDLAYGLGTITFHESGFRRDVHEGVGEESIGDCSFSHASDGHPISATLASAMMKRGEGGMVRRSCRSVCLAQINTGGLEGEKYGLHGRELVGLDQAATERCLMVSARMFAGARARCSKWQASTWFTPAIVGYGAGNGCESEQKWVRDRVTTFEKFRRGQGAAVVTASL